MQFPFDNSSIKDHRFHGLFQGTVCLTKDRKLLINTRDGVIQLVQRSREGHHHNMFWWLRKIAKSGDKSIFNVYGYPKTNCEGEIVKLVLMSFFAEGSKPCHDGINYKFNPGQMFLCGRIRRINDDKTISVKVKANKPNPEFRFCYITGKASSDVKLNSKTLFMAHADTSLQLHLHPIQIITPPGMKTIR
jgi:hypothetical protein